MIPALAVRLARGLRQVVMEQNQSGAVVTVGLERHLDAGRTDSQGPLGALEAPGEDDAARRLDLDVLAAHHVAAVGLDAERPTRARVDSRIMRAAYPRLRARR